MYGIGVQSCGSFVGVVDGATGSSKDEGDRFGFMSWAQGYLSHYNSSEPNIDSILGTSDRAAVQLWLYNYCRAHPLESFFEAVDKLITALYPRAP
jgi:hypothetical protein